MRLSWTFEEVDAKLKGIMQGIYHAADDAARRVRPRRVTTSWAPNIAGFLKVADAMIAQGIV